VKIIRHVSTEKGLIGILRVERVLVIRYRCTRAPRPRERSTPVQRSRARWKESVSLWVYGLMLSTSSAVTSLVHQKLKSPKQNRRVGDADVVHARANLHGDAEDIGLLARVLDDVEQVAHLVHDARNSSERSAVHNPCSLR
jgi:hypothetical protein